MRRSHAFTLIEMLAVILLTSIVLAAALNHYVTLTRVSERATATTAEVRRATAILDRVARDLESAILVTKTPDADPLEHPWIFYGESRRAEDGADHLRFVTRGRRPRAGAGHQSDLEVVAYSLRPSEELDDTYELMRWSSPRLPESLDRSIPDSEEEGALLMADELARFGITFIDEFGDRQSSWDSSLLAESSELPSAVEIEIALADPSNPDAEPRSFRRQVILPVKPLDMEELLDPTSLVSGGGGGDDGGEDELPDEMDEPTDDPRVTGDCLSTACANLRACAVINCTANLGRHGESVDLMLKDTINRQPSFCVWRGSQPRTMGFLVPDPSCRK